MKRFLSCALTGAFLLSATTALAKDVVLKDPKGDDKGPGKYTYPTHAVYTKGSFDLVEAKFRTTATTSRSPSR
jgi:carbohydrate-binding DOMON domain-containing protein